MQQDFRVPVRWRHLKLAIFVAASWCIAASSSLAEDCSSGSSFNSTFELIQSAIFERHDCTNSLCHGDARTGGLDLRAAAAYDSLLDIDAQTVSDFKRIVAGNKNRSLLWINLAAKTDPQKWTAPLRAMPLDPSAPLSAGELEAVRLWIEKGAPRDGVVPGTAELLNACLPPPEPITIKPLPPPAPGTGVQIKMAPWTLAAHSEREVCFATYYDVADQIPEHLRRPDGTFRYKLHETRQDPLSHHMVPILYSGETPITSPSWGGWSCRGGEQNGQPCDPLDTSSCGADGLCSTPIANSVACIGYGAGDGGIGLDTAGISITQQTAEEFVFAPGVYASLPMHGMVLWSSHAFNLTDKPGTLHAWLNFELAEPEEQITPAVQIFDASAVFKTNAPAFTTDEPCSISVFAPNAHLFELSSHTHHRGKRWRTFRGAFRCAGGANVGQPCSPLGYDFVSPDVCGGTACISMERRKVGDCDLSGEVTVDELVTGVGVALGTASVESCHEADGNDDWNVSIDELVTGVNAALGGLPPAVARDAEDSLMYVSLIYNDPVVSYLDPPLVLGGPGSSNDDRSLTFCSLYDNGFTNPAEVKTRSGSPPPPVSFPGIGGPCSKPTNCTKGRVAEACTGANDNKRNASCDSSEGAGDGLCDACPLKGGVTTEDEMFILLGRYYIP
jgi:hypothetical protein